jgi:hypothetical protein
MITTTPITQSFQFESLKKGDYLACEFHQNVHDYPKVYRFKIFQIVKVRNDTKEIILQTKNNIYFNYEMYANGQSNLKSAVLIDQKQ